MPRPLLALALCLPAAAACSDDGGGAGDDDVDRYDCAADDRDEEYIAGMEHVGAKGMTFRLVSSTPAPPQRNDNDWVIEILDDAGAPLAGATLEVTPFMPDHRHGTSIDAEVTEDTQILGRYELSPVNMFMPGVWEVTIEATPAGGGAADRDEAVFTFCIPQ